MDTNLKNDFFKQIYEDAIFFVSTVAILIGLFLIIDGGLVKQFSQKIIFVITFVLVPFQTLYLQRITAPQREQLKFIFQIYLFLATLGVVLFYITQNNLPMDSIDNFYLVLYFEILTWALFVTFFLMKKGHFKLINNMSFEKLNNFFYLPGVIYFLFFLIVTSPVNTESKFFNLFLSKIVFFEHWKLSFIFGASITTLLFYTLRYFSNVHKPTVFFLLTMIAIAGIFDPSISFHYAHYAPFSSGAHLMSGGAFPFVDAFSQYGFIPMLFYYFSFIIGGFSTQVGALATSLLSVVYCIMIAILMFRICNNSILAFFGSLIAIYFYQTGIGFNINKTPSDGGLRYLPCLIFLWNMFNLKENKKISWPLLFSILLSSIWSAETLLFCFLSYFCFLVVLLFLQPNKVKEISICLLAPIAACLGLHLIINIIAFLKTGEFINYQAYKELITAHVSSSLKVSWLLRIKGDFFGWILFLITYGLPLIWIVKNRTKLLISDSSNWRFLTIVVPTVAMGLNQSLYYLGRAIPEVLVLVSVPLFLILLFFLDQVVTRQIFYHSRAAVFISFVLVTVITTASFGRIEPGAEVSQGTLLGFCLYEKRPCSFASLTNYWKDKFSQKNKVESLYEIWPHTNTAISMINKFVPNEPEIALLIPEATTILLNINKKSLLSIGSDFSDSLSNTLVERAAKQVAKLKPSQYVFYYEKDGAYTGCSHIHQIVISEIKKTWKYKLIKNLNGVRLVQLKEKIM